MAYSAPSTARASGDGGPGKGLRAGGWDTPVKKEGGSQFPRCVKVSGDSGTVVFMKPSSELSSSFWGTDGARATLEGDGRLHVLIIRYEDDSDGNTGVIIEPLLDQEHLINLYTAGRQSARPTNEAEADEAAAARLLSSKQAELWERRGRGGTSAAASGPVHAAWRDICTLEEGDGGGGGGGGGVLTNTVASAMGMWAFDALLHRAKTIPSAEMRFRGMGGRVSASKNVRRLLDNLVASITLAAAPPGGGSSDPVEARESAMAALTSAIEELSRAVLSTAAYHLHMTDALAAPEGGVDDHPARSPRWLADQGLAAAVVDLFSSTVHGCDAQIKAAAPTPADTLPEHARYEVHLSAAGMESRARQLASHILDRCVDTRDNGKAPQPDVSRRAHLRVWGRSVASGPPSIDSLGDLVDAVEAYACSRLVEEASVDQAPSREDLIRLARGAAASEAPSSPLTNIADAVAWVSFNSLVHRETRLSASEKPREDQPFTVGLLDTYYASAAMRAASLLWARPSLWRAASHTLLVSDAYGVGHLEDTAASLMKPLSASHTSDAAQTRLFSDWLLAHGLSGDPSSQSYEAVASASPIPLGDLSRALAVSRKRGAPYVRGVHLATALFRAPAMFFFGAPVAEAIYVTGRSSKRAAYGSSTDLDAVGHHRLAALAVARMGLAIRGTRAPLGGLPVMDGASLYNLLTALMDSFRGPATGLDDQIYSAFMILHANPGKPAYHHLRPTSTPAFYVRPDGMAGEEGEVVEGADSPCSCSPPALEGFIADVLSGTPAPVASPFTRLLAMAGTYDPPVRVSITDSPLPSAPPAASAYMADAIAIAEKDTRAQLGADGGASCASDSLLEEESPELRATDPGTISAYANLLATAPITARTALAALSAPIDGAAPALMPMSLRDGALATLLGQLDLASALLRTVRVITSPTDPIAVAAAARFASDAAYAPLPPVNPSAEKVAGTLPSQLISAAGMPMSRPLLVVMNPTADAAGPTADVISADQHAALFSGIAQALVAAVRFQAAVRADPGLRSNQGVNEIKDSVTTLLQDLSRMEPIAAYIKEQPFVQLPPSTARSPHAA